MVGDLDRDMADAPGAVVDQGSLAGADSSTLLTTAPN
jgi:hypothetical protein